MTDHIRNADLAEGEPCPGCAPVRFIRFHEYCDWEGESWDFWLQLNGNEEEIQKLRALIEQAQEASGIVYDWPYTLTEDTENEAVVDNLVKYSEEGYMLTHNKVIGALTCPEDLGEHADKLYKGGIRDFFKKAS